MATSASSLFTALIRAEVRAWNSVETALSRAGNPLTLGRFLVLRTVRDTPACRIQEVASSQGITLGAASRLVDRLHRDGLLTRTRCTHDRRATILTVTDVGLAHLEAAAQKTAFSALSAPQREQLAHMLPSVGQSGDPVWRYASASEGVHA